MPRDPHRPPSSFPRSRRAVTGAAALVLAAGAGAALLVPGAEAVPTGDPVQIATVTKTPWELAVVPGGGSFVVERDGDVVYLDAQDKLQAAPALARTAIPNVRKLLGFALAPDFAQSGLAYLYVAQDQDPDGAGPATGQNGIWRLKATGGKLEVLGKVFGGIDSDGNHDGGRMVFGPDKDLYVTTGDIHQPTRPQDPTNLNGKILRLGAPATGDLTAPADNPFASQGGGAKYVWSIGHRHPQGLAFDAAGRLWETEHGPTGEQHGAQYPGGNDKTGRDELNLVVKGGNYGWPLVSGPMTGADLSPARTDLLPPKAVAGDAPAWAPGGLAVGADGSLYAPFLAGMQLHRFDVRNGTVYDQGQHLTNLGRLRLAVPRGKDLLVVQDSGTEAKIFRLPLSDPTPGGSDAATPPATGTPDAAAEALKVRTRTRALGLRFRNATRSLGRRRLEAGRYVSFRIGGPSAGRTTLELRLRNTRGKLFARTTVKTRSTATQRYRIRLGATGRKRLRAVRSGVMIVRVVHDPKVGKTFSTGFSTTIKRKR
ncbi:PQQ-dependent sugar dehydrogenase [Patulibacter minatonensis]|uniref:PQQ-dependent sugar dehydrogenase n=1 Tax=Patulibacter minatonensis TaxID=298163 RepID=UPI00047A0590|nr:PQQ-dependent sugar dehydrogenase [Patulibacter minatonensis]